MVDSALTHFDIKDTEEAKCKHCKETISYKTLTCLEDHLKNAHDAIEINEQDQNSDGDDSRIPAYKIRIKKNLHDDTELSKQYTIEARSDDEEEMLVERIDTTDDEGDKRRRRNFRSKAWNYFTPLKPAYKKEATCKLCGDVLSYKSSVTNLMHHVQRKHKALLLDDTLNLTVPVDGDNIRRHKLRSNAWNYFTPLKHAYKKEAKCKVCGLVLSYKSSVSNLMKHVNRKHTDLLLNGTRNLKTEPLDADNIRPHKPARIALWPYFKKVDKTAKICKCLICHSNVSYATTKAMYRHLKNKHPQLNKSEKDDGSKRILLSTNGELYEVDNDTMMSDHDNTKSEEVPLEAVYLDSFENLLQEVKSPKRKRKRAKSTTPKQMQIQNDSSDEEETSYNVATNGRAKQCDSLDLFGKYIVSLLRQLPKTKAIQLQGEFVKQIVLAQVNSENSEKHVENVKDSYHVTLNGTK